MSYPTGRPRTNMPERECPTCGRVLPANLLPRHERAHLPLRDRLFVPPAEQDKIVELYRHGGTLRSVAAATFWSRSEVRRVLIANGVTPRSRLGDFRPKITTEETLRRTQLYGRGLSIAEVAEVCGVNREAIRQTLKREGVKIRPTGLNRRHWRTGKPSTPRKRRGGPRPRPIPPRAAGAPQTRERGADA